MNGGKLPLGYTVIEVMIVLAVSGLMFVIATNFISGKQAKTSFTAGSNELASKVQDLIGEVNDGKYSDIPLSCSANIGGPTSVSDGAPDAETQGTNPQCVFLGKIL